MKKDRRRGGGNETAAKSDRYHGGDPEGAVVVKVERRRRPSGGEALKDDRHRSRGSGGVVVVKDDRHGEGGRKSRRRGAVADTTAAGMAGTPLAMGSGEVASPSGAAGRDAADGTESRDEGEPGLSRGRLRTEAGRYLRAVADDAEAQLGTADGKVDDATRRVWAAAFTLAARRRFDPDTPLAEVSRTVTTAVHTHAAVGLPGLETEMLVRAALGERVPVDEIDQAVVTAVHLLLFVSLTDELALAGPELDTLIAEAELSAGAGTVSSGARP